MKTSDYKIGQVIVSREGIEGEVVSVDIRRNRIKIVFSNGVTKTLNTNTINFKDFSSNPTTSVKEGEVYNTNNYGKIIVTKYTNARAIEVMFEDGTITTVQVSSIKLGNVGHPKSGIPEGYTFVNTDGVKGEVIKYHDPLNVDITWEDGNITYNHTAANVKKGSVYYSNFRSVAGVGYFGLGNYKPDRNGKNGNYNKTVYRKWMQMITRCYSEEEQKKPSCKAYVNVKVCTEWHNFQNFASWAEDKEDRFIKGWELDKDLFGNGKLYCPEYCTLLPKKINWFLSDRYSHKQSDLPEGVNVIEPNLKYPNTKIGYIARCHINNKREYLGFYNTPEQAGKVYREAKEGEARRLADEYKEVLTQKQYEKLKTFTLEDIHRKETH